MRLITKNIYYAIRFLLYIVQKPNEMAFAGELVDKLKMPRTF